MYYFIFHKPDNSYYFKLKGYIYHMRHPLHWTNQYGHEIVLIISIPRSFYRRLHPIKYYKKIVIKKIIRFLDKILNKLD